MPLDLFKPIVPANRLHPNFVRTLEANAAGVREVISSWADGFVDRDGKFVREFQTSYNSSFWELYLHAVLKHLHLPVDFSVSSPDFVCAQHPMAIEAAIASHADGDVPEWQKTVEGVMHDDVLGAYLQSIIRLSNAFQGKVSALRQKYKALNHMTDRAYVVAIAHYGTQDFNMLGDVAMQRLLYDVWEEGFVTKSNGAQVRVGLFKGDAFADVSAVAYSSLATFGKARALGTDQGDFIFHAFRIRNNTQPIQIVAKKSDYSESLTDGLRIFVNPFATIPIDVELFNDPGIRIFIPQPNGDMVVSCHPEGDLCLRVVFRNIRRAEADL